MAALGAAGPAVAQTPEVPIAPPESAAVAIRTRPAPLVRGTLGVLRVRPVPGPGRTIVQLTGSAAGEPLHFEPDGAGGFWALAAAPIEGTDSLPVTVAVEWLGDRLETVGTNLPLAAGSYRTERLRVAERYARPDSAAVARIQEENQRARDLAHAAHLTPRLWSAPFRAPRPGRVTSRFGTAREFNGEILSRHLGTDFTGAVGAPVRAANRGVVALVADFYLAGTAVYLDHGEGLVTGYFHLSRAEVAAGDTVRRGQIIGRVGHSGRVTGPHLHWIARYGGITVDPMSLLRLPTPSASRRAPAVPLSGRPSPDSASSPGPRRSP